MPQAHEFNFLRKWILYFILFLFPLGFIHAQQYTRQGARNQKELNQFAKYQRKMVAWEEEGRLIG